MPSSKEILAQSKSAYNQWCKQWREQAKHHSRYKMKNLEDFRNSGIGKAMLLVATGASLDFEIETIKKYQDNVDIMCCDKSLGYLLDHGVTPTYVMVCDANVNYEKYMEKWKDQLENITLFTNVCANPKWTDNGNWKDRYFFVNKDILRSENEFSQISGCRNIVPAGTNVSNAMVVFMSQSDNSGRHNFFGYDKYLLIGFDYSWSDDSNYYAGSYDGDGKRYYMKHLFVRNMNYDQAYTSTNLMFSARWLDKYINTFKLPVVQCTKRSIFGSAYQGDLAEQMQYSYKKDDTIVVRDLLKMKNKIAQEMSMINSKLLEIGNDHHYHFRATV